jgi:hypothetical protein
MLQVGDFVLLAIHSEYLLYLKYSYSFMQMCIFLTFSTEIDGLDEDEGL